MPRKICTNPKWHGHDATDIDRPPPCEYKMLDNPPSSSPILHSITGPYSGVLSGYPHCSPATFFMESLHYHPARLGIPRFASRTFRIMTFFQANVR